MNEPSIQETEWALDIRRRWLEGTIPYATAFGLLQAKYGSMTIEKILTRPDDNRPERVQEIQSATATRLRRSLGFN